MKKPVFVFVVDSHADEFLHETLRSLGLKSNESYAIHGAGGAVSIKHGEIGSRPVDAEKLLVFMSSFHGHVRPAINFAQEIKTINPTAQIIFRSMEDDGGILHPVFAGRLEKVSLADPDAQDEFKNLVRTFLDATTTE